MAGEPEDQTSNPHLQAEPKSGGKRTVDDRQPARCPAKQNGLGQRAVDRRLEAFDVLSAVHPASAPPPKLKKLRKKDDAAKAIDRPKTIWISRRKPPAVSPKASVSPVVMMMITATILATGPCTESRTFCSGSSQGMPEPAAWAWEARMIIIAATGRWMRG